MKAIISNGEIWLKRLTALSILAVCFLVYSLTLSKAFYGYEEASANYARQLMYLGYSHIHTPAGIADIIFYMPFELLSNVIAGDYENTLRNFVVIHALPFAASLICLIFFFMVLDLYGSARLAASLALLLAFTTMHLPYSKMGMELQHSLWILFSVWMIIRWILRRDKKYLALAGMGAGLIMLTKLYGFVASGAIILFLIYDIFSERERRKEWLNASLHFLIPFCAIIILLLIHNRLRYNGWIIGERYNLEYESKTVPIWQPLFGFLFSSGKSIFIYNPLLIAAVFYLRPFFRENRRLAMLWVMIFASGFLFHSLMWIWTDESWGPRKLHYLVPLAMLPMGIMVREFRRMKIAARTAIIFLAVMGLAVQILGTALNYEAQPECLKWRQLSSMENIRHNPRLSHTTFNCALLFSTIERFLTGNTHYFIYDPTFLMTVRPDNPRPHDAMDLQGFSFFDVWFVDRNPIRRGKLFLFDPMKKYLQFLLIAIPLAFLALYIFSRRMDGEKKSWISAPAGWLFPLFFAAGICLCLIYSKAYTREKNAFLADIPPVLDLAIGDDTRDEKLLGNGWRISEWMTDPKDPSYKIPFRWTNRSVSQIFLPCKPNTSYKLAIEMVSIYPGRQTVWVNNRRLKYVWSQKQNFQTWEMIVPAEVVGHNYVSTVSIQHYSLHIPAQEEPGVSKDTSILGVMVYGLNWMEIESDAAQKKR